MKRIIVSLVAVLAAAVVVLPVGAGVSTPTGVRLSLLGGTSRGILADTPFYVKHGFRTVAGDSSPQEIQQSSFTLSVDGVSQRGVIIQEFSDTTPRVLTGKFSLFNFPNGLPVGIYTFTIAFKFQGKVILTNDLTVYVQTSCQYGTFDNLQCSGPPA
jgi:hypothetical protein